MRRLALLLAEALALGSAFGLDRAYPALGSLSPQDLLFRQLMDTVEAGYRAERSGKPFPDLFFLEYAAPEPTDLYAVAARASLPYDAVATLNGVGGPFRLAKGAKLLLPSYAGVFVPVVPVRDFEYLLASSRAAAGEPFFEVRVNLPAGARDFRFFPGSRFNATERSFFLNAQFRFPLPAARLTSSFGYRASPFTGKPSRHDGVDLAAPEGTEVYAARGGTVAFVGSDAVLGNHVIVAHEGGWSTVYGHLRSVAVRLNQSVLSGTILGTVGSTGQSTGPHLHFEIRIQGAARDPATMIPRISR